MSIAIRLAKTGDPTVLEHHRVQRDEPAPDEAWIEHDAIGVNYLDVMQRQGFVRIPLPSGIGLEGAGRVLAVGREVSTVNVGDRVGYMLGPLGSYADGRIYPANRLLRLPDDLSTSDAAALLFKGITAHYLLTSTYVVTKGTTVLLYGAAGALGQLLASWATHLGARVIGVVSKRASVERAMSAGCAAVLVWGSDDLIAEVSRLTDGRKADVVYDGIGKTTFATSLSCVRPRGLMVSIGASSGAPSPIEIGMLNEKGSLYLTRPGLAAHATDLTEYRRRAEAVFAATRQGIIRPAIWKTFSLVDAASAHSALEDGSAAGAIVLTT